MAADRWQRLQELFEAASRLRPAERARYLDGCGESDAALRSEVEALLRADEPSSGLFLAPVAGVAASFSAHPPDADNAPIDSASAPREGEPSLVGRRIGAYQLTGELGRGGMGTVYRAVRADDAYRKEVAIKLIRHGAGHASCSAGSWHERQILATPRSPQHRAPPRRRHHRRRRALLGHGARGGGGARRITATRALSPSRRGCGCSWTSARSRAVRPPAPGRSPRPQARQHPRHRGRHAQASRLRHRQAARRASIPASAPDRHRAAR